LADYITGVFPCSVTSVVPDEISRTPLLSSHAHQKQNDSPKAGRRFVINRGYVCTYRPQVCRTRFLQPELAVSREHDQEGCRLRVRVSSKG
jgi:hypothetical protein